MLARASVFSRLSGRECAPSSRRAGSKRDRVRKTDLGGERMNSFAASSFIKACGDRPRNRLFQSPCLIHHHHSSASFQSHRYGIIDIPCPSCKLNHLALPPDAGDGDGDGDNDASLFHCCRAPQANAVAIGAGPPSLRRRTSRFKSRRSEQSKWGAGRDIYTITTHKLQ